MAARLDAADAYDAGELGIGEWERQLVGFHNALRDADLPFFIDAVLTRGPSES